MVSPDRFTEPAVPASTDFVVGRQFAVVPPTGFLQLADTSHVSVRQKRIGERGRIFAFLTDHLTGISSTVGKFRR